MLQSGYLPLGTAKINGRSIGVYVFQNGAKLGDEAGQGQGFADVFDSAGHLLRRFIFRGIKLAATNHRIRLHARAFSQEERLF